MSLLLLRTVFGIAVLVDGGYYLGAPNPTVATRSVGILAFAMGILLIAGFLTPIAGTLVGLQALALALSIIPASTPNLWGSEMAVTFGVTILLAILGLGPGAFSVDARVFGRREIIIPPSDFSAGGPD